MEASLRLRAQDYAAHDRWLVNLQDVITSNRLDDLWENQQVPTLEAVQRQFTRETSAKQQELFAIAMKQWQTENTQLYAQSCSGRDADQFDGWSHHHREHGLQGTSPEPKPSSRLLLIIGPLGAAMAKAMQHRPRLTQHNRPR